MAAETHQLYFAQHPTVSLQKILTQRKNGQNFKQIENTRTLDFAAMFKIQIWDTSFTSDDKEHTWETILNECSQKVWKVFSLKERANIQSESYRVETVTKETGWRSRLETLSNTVAPNAGIMVNFEKQISCPIQVLSF